MFKDGIKILNMQFTFEPRIENGDLPVGFENFIVCGMGGSNLASGLLKIWKPELEITMHRGYGLPLITDETKTLVILSSYSGETEETLDAYRTALSRKLKIAVISKGGRLLELAKENGTPFIRLPEGEIQPRLALGLSLKAMLKLLGEEAALKEVSELAGLLHPSDYETAGKELAAKLQHRIPIVYSSSRNAPMTYIWKIKFNETAKIPAFCNYFPELNHNEMAGFDVAHGARNLSEKFHFVFLRDADDDGRETKRMDTTRKILEERGLQVELVSLESGSVWKKIFASLFVADWSAYYLATAGGVEPGLVPIVEEFKKLMK